MNTRTNLDAISGLSLGSLIRRRRLGIAGIKTIDTLLPRLHENTGSEIFNGLPNMFDFGKRVFPDSSLAPLFTFLFALIRSAH